MNCLAEGDLLLSAGHSIEEAEHLFSRIPDEVIDQQVERLRLAESEQTKGAELPELASEISFEDFQKPDLRTAKILSAQKVPKTKKLLEIRVDMGLEERTVVSGIAEYFQPEDIIGRQVVLVANLAPRKIRGVQSQGMILMAESPSGTLQFVSAEEAAVPGSRVK
jgi:methionyl-tRNA synthetase